jgi:hypothetical protein
VGPKKSVGNIDPTLTITVDKVAVDGVDQLQVDLYYWEENAPTLLQKADCISGVVYQVSGNYNSGPRRISLQGDNVIPAWPSVVNTFDEDTENTRLRFYITPSDMRNKECKKAPGDGMDTYYCYFEFAFNVAGIT